MECGATKRDGTPCRAPAMQNGRCRIHGGLSPAGIASPTFKTGRYSKALPGGLRQRYEQALDDDDLLSLREEVALVDAHLSEVLTGPASDDKWARALVLVEQRRKLVESEQRRLATLNQYVTVEQIHTFIAALGAILRRHVADRAALAAIQRDLGGLLARPAGVVIDAERDA